MMSIKNILILLASIVILVGCGVWSKIENQLPDRHTEYKKSHSTKPLEIPPDLSEKMIEDTLYIPDLPQQQEKSDVKASDVPSILNDSSELQQETVRIERDGRKRWLVATGYVDQIWDDVVLFWQKQGFELALKQKNIGIMETEWLENRADIPEDFIRDKLKTVVDNAYSAPTRDKYRTRLESGVLENTVEIYMTHYGVEEVMTYGPTGTPESTQWQARDSDAELEAQMLSQLMVYLGGEQQTAKQLLKTSGKTKARSQLVENQQGQSYILIDEAFYRAWRLTGIALDKSGVSIEDRNRDKGLYYIRYQDSDAKAEESAWLDNIAFWQEDEQDTAAEYRVNLRKQGEQTKVLILNAEGKQDNSSTAIKILKALHQKLL